MKKCLLSVLTASIMTLTAVPFTAIAAETAPTTSQTSEAAEVNDLSVIAQKLKEFVKEKGYDTTVTASDEKVVVSFKQQAVGEKEYDATAINSEFRTFCEKNSLNFSLVQVIFLVDDADLKTDYNFLSYNELTKLTNEEFSEKFNLSDYHFGDDSISDEIKFQEYLNQPIAGFVGDNYESVAYAAYLKFTRGENVPYITFSVDRYTKMDNSLTPEDFGYPKEWKITAYDCVLSTESRYPRQMHEYRIEVPIDIISDFEEYVRLEKSSYYSRNYSKNNPYGITSFFDIDYQFASKGGNISNLYGDANCDFEVSMADAVLIMQSLANPDKYVLDGIGRINADMDGDGITNADALAIQKKLLKLD